MDKIKRFSTIKNILIIVGLIIFDLIVYILLGLMLMNYDDFYDKSKGDYWSLESMSFWEKTNYIGLNIWNLVNIIALVYITYLIIKEIKKSNRFGNKKTI